MPTSSSTPDSNCSRGSASSHTPLSTAVAAKRTRAKGRETELRHKEERRHERLRDIRAQIADGTLVVRQMTVAERDGWSADTAPIRPMRRA